MLEVWHSIPCASAQPLSLAPDTVAVGRVWLVSDATFASFGHGLQLRRQDSFNKRNGGMLGKHSSVPRASYFDGSYKQSRNAKKSSSASGEFPQESNASCGHLVGESISLPNSLRVLKRQQQQRRKNPLETSSEGGVVGCSMKKAFSSMVYMLKSMQSYTLQMRQLLFSEDHFQEMWSFVQRETHASFLWLFQQVFACTPKLMISVMILLANFTVYSMDNSMAMGSMLPTVESPSSSVSCLADSGSVLGLSAQLRVADADADADSAAPIASVTGNNNNGSRGGKSVIVAGGMDGDGLVGGSHYRRTMYSQEESAAEAHVSAEIVVHPESLQAAGMNYAQVGKDPLFLDAQESSSNNETQGFDEEVSRQQHMERSDELIFKFLLQEAAKETEMPHKISLELDSRQTLVAPVTAKLEPDNYECYDRTDLLYQHALSLDGANPLLLANYAHFLHVVRHDHDRAENFFRRATGVDPSDGEVMSRFASFLWLARGDQSGAEAAYKDAIASDPSNPFYAGSYAHFLWHAAEEEAAPCAAKPAIFGTDS